MALLFLDASIGSNLLGVLLLVIKPNHHYLHCNNKFQTTQHSQGKALIYYSATARNIIISTKIK